MAIDLLGMVKEYYGRESKGNVTTKGSSITYFLNLMKLVDCQGAPLPFVFFVAKVGIGYQAKDDAPPGIAMVVIQLRGYQHM